jgi:hypothetical protein
MTKEKLTRIAVAAIAAAVLAACSSGAQDHPQGSSDPNPIQCPSVGPGVNAEANPANTAGPNNATTAQVLAAVKAAECVTTLPDSVAASLAGDDEAGGKNRFDCNAGIEQQVKNNTYGECALGDPNGTKLMVIYGDSRAYMWGATLEGVAAKSGWKLRVFSSGGCPVPDLNFLNIETKAPFKECDAFHAQTPPIIQALHPDLVLVTSIADDRVPMADGSKPTPAQWQQGWESTLHTLAQPGTRLAMIGSFPFWDGGARCLAAHIRAVQQCSADANKVRPPYLDAEQAAASAAGALYASTMPWLCADRCEPFIAGMRVLGKGAHITQSYAVYLTGAMSEALQPAIG